MKFKNYLFLFIFSALWQSQLRATNISNYLFARTLGFHTSLMRYDIPIAWKYEHKWQNHTFVKSVLENLDALNAEQCEELYKNREHVRAYLFSKISNSLKLEIASHTSVSEPFIDKDIQYSALFISLYTSIINPIWESHPLRKIHHNNDDDEYENDFDEEKTQIFRTYTLTREQILKTRDWYQIVQLVKSPSFKKQANVEEPSQSEIVHIFHELGSLYKASSMGVLSDHYRKIYEHLINRKAQGILTQKKRNLKSSLSTVLRDKSAYPLLKIIENVLDEKDERLAASL